MDGADPLRYGALYSSGFSKASCSGPAVRGCVYCKLLGGIPCARLLADTANAVHRARSKSRFTRGLRECLLPAKAPDSGQIHVCIDVRTKYGQSELISAGHRPAIGD